MPSAATRHRQPAIGRSSDGRQKLQIAQIRSRDALPEYLTPCWCSSLDNTFGQHFGMNTAFYLHSERPLPTPSKSSTVI